MEIAHITPTAHLDDLLGDCHYHLVLTRPTIEDEKYRDFYRKRIQRGDYVILDNDAHELKDAPMQTKLELLQRAIDLLGPDEVVLPDRMGGEAQETVDLALEAIDKLDYKGNYMAVPHASTLQEFYECAQALWDIGEVCCLGISYVPVEQRLKTTRAAVVHMLSDLIPQAQFHMLGESASLRTLLDKDLHPKVRGLDTAKLVNWGIALQRVTADNIPPHKGRTGGPFEYFNEKLSWQQLWYAHKNIEYWRHYINAVD